MKLLCAATGPLLFCLVIAAAFHLWGLKVRRNRSTIEPHRVGAILFWALMCAAYLSEASIKAQSLMIRNGFTARTSHHVFGVLLVFVSLMAAGVIDLVSKTVSGTRITAN